MRIQTTIGKLAPFFAVGALLTTACSEAFTTAPKPESAGESSPMFAVTGPGASGIALDQFNGTSGQTGTTFLVKGFNPANPHRGDAIIATFYWVGSATIQSVRDVITTSPEYTPVGNTYTLVESVSNGGYNMATYVAANVQGFADPVTDQGQILAVQAFFSQPITDGAVLISSWVGVNSVAAQALGSHRSASGTASGGSLIGPGSVSIGAGALAYGVSMSNGLVGRDPPLGFTRIDAGSDAFLVQEGDYAVQSGVGTIDPKWFWAFADSPPSTWLTSVLVLNPPLHLAFTVQPSNTLPLMAIQPIKVTALDADGHPVTSYNGPVTIAIGRNGGTVLPGTLSGTKTVTAVNGVATFSDLSIDQPGNGYTLVVDAANLFGAQSAAFNIGAGVP